MKERGKMEAANHLMLVNCFMIEMLNDRQLYSVKQLLDFFFLKYAHFERERERERERGREGERLNVRVLIICICLSVPTNNEIVNLVLLQKHVVDEKYSVWKLFYYNKSRGVVLTSLCAHVMCVRESIKAACIYVYIYIYIYIHTHTHSPPKVLEQ